MDVDERLKEARIACLSGVFDLQRACQRENLSFSRETNQFLVYLTLKKVGPVVAQKLVSKLVERGDIVWNGDQSWEVEQILDHDDDEEGKKFYYIKWKGWSNAHNSWEPEENLDSPDLVAEYNAKFTADYTRQKRPLMSPDDGEHEVKRRRVDEIFQRLVPLQQQISPLQLLSLSSPKKGQRPLFKGLIPTKGKLPKFVPTAKYLNPRTKVYKQLKAEAKKAMKEWEERLNKINTDPAGLTVENDVDLEGPPDNFEYINDYKEGEGIIIPNDPLVGCECEDCFENKNDCCPDACGAQFSYYKYKRVRVPRGSPIYECNKRCKCGLDCPNRVVQLGRKFKVCIFRTANSRGWGVKTLQKIKKGSFVMEYVGEVITNEEAERRGMEYDATGRTYLFDLDYNDGDCPFTVDACNYGNVSHFVNHSCDPNLEVYGVWINTLDPRLPRIALFSKRDIQKGEELTFDYMMTGDTTNQDVVDLTETMRETNNNTEMGPPSIEVSKVTTVIPSELADDPTFVSSNDNEETTDSDLSATENINDPVAICEKDNYLSATENINDPVAICEKDNSDPTAPVGSETGDSGVSSDATTAKTHDTMLNNLAASEDVGKVSSPKKADVHFGGDANQIHSDSASEVVVPKKQPKLVIANSAISKTEQYRIVCQCGAKNCRKYLF